MDETKTAPVATFSVDEVINEGPPPDMLRRQLVFDSLSKIIDNKAYNRALARSSGGDGKEDRGTFVYTWGAGYHGQLGRKGARGQKKYATLPMMVELIKAVRQVACGGLHTASLTDKGEVYTWGDGRMGQLGNLDEGYNSHLTPHRVDSLTPRYVIKQVSCGQHHTVVVTDQGKLLSFGWGKYGQTGLGERGNKRFPEDISVEPKAGVDSFFVQVACGDRHTVALTRKGQVFTFGCGEHGQLGHGNQADQSKPTLVEEFQHAGINIIQVATGAVHSAALTDQGQLYVWGFGEHFYRSGGKNFYYTPQLIEFKGKIVQVACGQSHILVLTDKGEVFTWGCGEYGQLGHGDQTNNRVPRIVLEGKNICQIAAGRYHSVALASNGAMFTWGCGENGQLGHNSDENEMLPRVVEGILGNVVGQVSCGEHHTAALTSCPYSKIAEDVLEWYSIEREEYLLKKQIVAETHRPLARKDLAFVRAKVAARRSGAADPTMMLDDELPASRGQDGRTSPLGDRLSKSAQVTKKKTGLSLSSTAPSSSSFAAQASPPAAVPKPTPRAAASKDVSASSASSAASASSALSGSSTVPSLDLKNASALIGSSTTGLSSTRRSLSKTGDALSMTAEGPHSARTLFHRENITPLKDMISSLQSAVTQNNSQAQEMQAIFNQVCALRKEYDKVKSAATLKENEWKNLQRELESLQRAYQSSQSGDKQMEKRVNDLEMQLDTVNIKIAETEDNRRNYELNIAHLKEEELENLLKLDALRRACAENNNLHRKMSEMKSRALHDRAQAEAEKETFLAEIIEYRQFLNEQRKVFENVTETVLAAAHTRDLEREKRENVSRVKASGRMEKLQVALREKELEAESLQARLHELRVELEKYQASFVQISTATGLTEPEEIINKFFLKEDIRSELQKEVESKTAKLDSLKSKRDEYTQLLQVKKDTFTDSKWRDVGQVQERVREAMVKAEKRQSEIDRTTQRLAFLQEGIVALARRVNRVLGANDEMSIPTDLSAVACSNLLAGFESKLTEVIAINASGGPSKSASAHLETSASRAGSAADNHGVHFSSSTNASSNFLSALAGSPAKKSARKSFQGASAFLQISKGSEKTRRASSNLQKSESASSSGVGISVNSGTS